MPVLHDLRLEQVDYALFRIHSSEEVGVVAGDRRAKAGVHQTVEREAQAPLLQEAVSVKLAQVSQVDSLGLALDRRFADRRK